MKFGAVVRAALPVDQARSIEDPTRPLTGAEFSSYFLYGDPDGGAGVRVSESTAMGLTAYLRAISLISSSVAGLPIRVYYRGTRRPVLQRTVLDSPSETQTPFEFWQTVMMAQLSWGRAFAMKTRDGAGRVVKLDHIHPSRVTVEKAGGRHLFDVTSDDGETRRYTSLEIAHFPFLSPDGVTGLSPLQACRTVLGSAMAAEKVTESFFRNGTKLSGIVKTQATLNDSQAGAIKSRWRQLFAGPQKAGEVAVLDSGAEFQPLTLPPEDAKLLQSRAFSVTEIARMFGVPSHFLNDQEKATAWGSGIESMGIGYVIYTLQPRVQTLEQRITRELLPGGWESGAWEARMDLKGLLRGDAAGRASFYRSMTDLKAMTNHDVAALEDMDPPPGTPVYAMPSNYALVDAATGDVTPLTGDLVTPQTVDTTPNDGGQANA
ncbi:MAG: phage portal protein [Phycisphaerales bacterium]